MPRLRHAATAFAATYCDEDTQWAVALAVTEACSNVVRHAYPEGAGELTVTARLEDTCLIFRISDRGAGLDAASREEGAGMGLTLMQRLGDAHITSDGRGTHVELRFPATPAAV